MATKDSARVDIVTRKAVVRAPVTLCNAFTKKKVNG